MVANLCMIRHIVATNVCSIHEVQKVGAKHVTMVSLICLISAAVQYYNIMYMGEESIRHQGAIYK